MRKEEDEHGERKRKKLNKMEFKLHFFSSSITCDLKHRVDETRFDAL